MVASLNWASWKNRGPHLKADRTALKHHQLRSPDCTLVTQPRGHPRNVRERRTPLRLPGSCVVVRVWFRVLLGHR